MTDSTQAKPARPGSAASRAALEQLTQRLNRRQARGPDWTQKTYEIEVVTPIMGGGVDPGEPDDEMPVRATEIRAQLRFWWRLLASTGGLPGVFSGKPLCGKQLFQAERERFGGTGDRNDGFAGQLAVRVVLLSQHVSPITYQVQENVDRTRNGRTTTVREWVVAQPFRSAPDYALFPARRENQRPPRKLWPAGFRFRLHLEFNPESAKEIEASLRWWAAFGGIGARTRRGSGAVRVTENGELLSPFRVDEAERSAGCLLRLCGVSHANATSDWAGQIAAKATADAVAAWKIAVDRLKEFRQGTNVGRNPGFGQSRWPEPLAVRKLAKTHRIKASGFPFSPDPNWPEVFPRAAFGMPIVFHFKNDSGEGRPGRTPRPPDQRFDPDATLEPKGGGRLSSPLILKAMAVQLGGQVKYVPIALLLPDAHVWTASLELRDLDQDGVKLPSPVSIAEWWPSDDAQRKALIARAETPVPGGKRRPLAPMFEKGGGALDPLRAFLHFFSQP